MTRILVTGGAGFLGHNLVHKLVKLEHEVTVLDNGSRGNIKNLTTVLDKIKYVKGDIRNELVVDAATKDIDLIYHFAFINGTEHFYHHPDQVLDIGINGTMNIFECAMQNKVPRIIFASSSEVYQTPPITPTPEDVPLIIPDVKNPRYSYGGAKILGELVAANYSKYFEQVLVFRPHNVYGPRMGFEHVIPQFIKKALQKKTKFQIQGTGNETRSFNYIDDFIDGLLLISKSTEKYDVFNIGSVDEIAIKDLAQKILAILKTEKKIEHIPLLEGSTPRRCPDISKLCALGYTPQVSLDEGLRKTVDYYRNL